MTTVRPALQPNVIFVELTDDDGNVGLGEAFFGASVVEQYLHDVAAGPLLALPAANPELVAHELRPYAGYQGSGAELRGNAAIDLALWDLMGKRSGLTLAELLGGPVRTELPIYNTCAGPDYIRAESQQRSDNWGLPAGAELDRFDDLHAFFTKPRELARSLYDSGITHMKIWPFDRAAERTRGTDITRQELRDALSIVGAIRDEVGDDMEIMIELHGLWQREPAARILRALEEFRPYWVEDPMRVDAIDALAHLRQETSVPIATGETCVGRRGFKPLFDAGVIDIATVDLQWTGGLTEARKVATLADLYGVRVAPHDCTGPVSLAAGAHLTASQPNGLIQESVRAFLNSWYPALVTGIPEIERGTLRLSDAPGHGIVLHDRTRDESNSVVRTTALDTARIFA